VPVGDPVFGATTLTVAVKVTGWPDKEGFEEDTTAVVVGLTEFTVCVSAAEVLAVKLLSPL
jgi:hypothetical protein